MSTTKLEVQMAQQIKELRAELKLVKAENESQTQIIADAGAACEELRERAEKAERKLDEARAASVALREGLVRIVNANEINHQGITISTSEQACSIAEELLASPNPGAGILKDKDHA